MSCTITIPFWPDSTDCLDWSADNQIAVTGGEQIAILNPRNKEKGLNGSLWDTSLLKVNAFTAKELPLLDSPLSNANFSLGEEVSFRQAIEAKWSPPGLAIHKGCALAVLTADHVLSVWAPNGRSNVAENWKRQAITNDTIMQFYRTKDALQQNETNDQPSQQQREHDQVRQRIRSFAWSPALTRSDGNDEHYLAVSTEGGDVLFLRVKSPHCRTLTKATGWELTVVGASDLRSLSESPVQRKATRPCFAEYLSWNDWATDTAGNFVARFAYICGGRLFTTSVRRSKVANTPGTSDQLDIDVSRRVLNDRDDVTGPLRFARGDQHGSLIAFGIDTVFQVDFDDDAPLARTHHLDDRWDSVSGVAFTNPGDGSTLLHVISLLEMATAATTTLSLPLEGDETSIQPSWQHAISEYKAAFGADHDLDRNVMDRTSGIANSPLGDYIVTCTTMHPSDCIEYVVGSDQKSMLSFTWESECPAGHFLPQPPSSISPTLSAEAILFSLVRQLERNAEIEEPDTVDRDSLIAEVLQYRRPSQDIVNNDSNLLEALGNGPDVLHRHIKKAILAHAEVLAAQASRLVDIALNPNGPRAEVVRPVVQRLVQEFTRLTGQVASNDSLSQRIRATFAIVASKLSPTQDPHVNGDAQGNSEVCTICEKPVPFESLRWAKCVSGHQFSRCSLSFLPIQEPGTTKSCGICGLQYFNEKIFSDVEPATDDIEMADVPSTESNIDNPANDTWVEVSRNPNAFPQRTPSLAQILFTASDICTYCGGKFVD
ncbi:hypothetical protein PRZ48_010760 [Zasmidium cellare]|uniref:Transcription factor IIIC 90kDa subunit N-terminal domain-containing protein n=1 Tax=Zasmidium cellare TaxID=395010 RepID=A0ABR0E9W1_ZASCE|nr:hypothetical protein PRZ48_010760 [Zasmidium cellare]